VFTTATPPTRHFLHIGKTGGSAVADALQSVDAEHRVLLHGHKTVLSDIPAGEHAVFFVRDPVTRFVSGFNSRLRQGRPRYDVPWRPKEVAAFSRFPTPNRLAEALADEDHEVRAAAEQAMNSIAHVNKHLRHFLVSTDYLARRAADILFVGFQETLATDFSRLKQLLRLPETIRLSDDPVAIHRTPAGFSTNLSRRGEEAIRHWYREDVDIYAYLQKAGSAADVLPG
jgi:hypothetical protein